MSNVASGPSVKFLVHNIHTMDELRLSGNCLRASRPVLSFSHSFNKKPHFALIKELIKQVCFHFFLSSAPVYYLCHSVLVHELHYFLYIFCNTLQGGKEMILSVSEFQWVIMHREEYQYTSFILTDNFIPSFL